MSAFVLITAGPTHTPLTAAAPAQTNAQPQALALVGAPAGPPVASPTEALDFEDNATSEAKTAEAAAEAAASAEVAAAAAGASGGGGGSGRRRGGPTAEPGAG